MYKKFLKINILEMKVCIGLSPTKSFVIDFRIFVRATIHKVFGDYDTFVDNLLIRQEAPVCIRETI